MMNTSLGESRERTVSPFHWCGPWEMHQQGGQSDAQWGKVRILGTRRDGQDGESPLNCVKVSYQFLRKKAVQL